MKDKDKELLLNDMLYRQGYRKGCSFDIGEPDYTDIVGFLKRELEVLPPIDATWIYEQIKFVNKMENANEEKQKEYFDGLRKKDVIVNFKTMFYEKPLKIKNKI